MPRSDARENNGSSRGRERSKVQRNEQKDRSPMMPMPSMRQLERRTGNFFAPIFDLHDQLNSAIKESVHMAADLWPGGAAKLMPKLKVWEDEKAFYLNTNLPSDDPDNIEVVVSDDFLVLKWQEERQVKSGTGYSYSMQSCHRTVMLPPNADAEQARATLKNGRLEVVVAKSRDSERQGRSIPVERV